MTDVKKIKFEFFRRNKNFAILWFGGHLLLLVMFNGVTRTALKIKFYNFFCGFLNLLTNFSIFLNSVGREGVTSLVVLKCL